MPCSRRAGPPTRRAEAIRDVIPWSGIPEGSITRTAPRVQLPIRFYFGWSLINPAAAALPLCEPAQTFLNHRDVSPHAAIEAVLGWRLDGEYARTMLQMEPKGLWEANLFEH